MLAPPLVSTEWLSDELGKEKTPSVSNIRVLDSTVVLPQTVEVRNSYRIEHIPGSLHFDLNECKDKSSSISFRPPPAEEFGKYVGDLGIDNDTHVVVYENDPRFKLISAPRVWWMFRLFGHEKVSVLDGGMRQWKADGHPVETGDGPVVDRRVFEAKPHNPKLIKQLDDVLKNQETEEFKLIDVRKPEWFDGSKESIIPDMPLGYIRKTTNMPFGSFLRDDSDRMKSPDDILKLFHSAGIDPSKPLACHCFMGFAASTVAFAAFVATGNEDAAVYDGGWEEFIKSAPEEARVIVPDPKV